MNSFLQWLQDFSHRRSRYERPTEKWVCGNVKNGVCCPQGPDANGQCKVTCLCTPYKKGDRWYCSRSELNGGPCDPGPGPDGKCGCPIVPCTPVLSVRARRGRVAFLVFAAAVGTLFCIFSLYRPSVVVSPGPLNAHHAPLGSNCAQCHGSVDKGFIQWTLTSQKGFKQNERCLTCHSNFNKPDFPRIHSIPKGDLAELRDQMKHSPGGRSLVHQISAAITPSVPHDSDGNLECARCHREHHGADANISDLSNTQCQSCHSRQFDSFKHGHPELGRVVLATADIYDMGEFKKHLLEKRNQQGSISQAIWTAMPKQLQDDLSSGSSGDQPQLVKASLISTMNGFLQQEGRKKKGNNVFQNQREARIALQAEFQDDLSPNFLYPYQRRTRIAFNHNSHINGYFQSTQKKAPTSCTDCHTPEDQGRNIAFKGFQQSCATCHTAQIVPNQEDKTSGFALFRIPLLDVATLKKSNISIGQYPANAQGDLTVITKLLISGDEQYREFDADLRRVATLQSWEDLSAATPEQLVAIQRIIMGLKRLYVDCAKQGKEAIRARLTKAVGSQLTPDVIDYLLKPLPMDVIKGMQSKAIPNLEQEMSAAGNHPTVSLFDSADSIDYSLLYQPKKHTDNYMQTWLTVAVMSKNASAIFNSSPGVHKGFQSCVICHTVEEDENRVVSINWHTWSEKTNERTFTKFAHAPHLTTQCQQCHIIEARVDNDRFKNSFQRLTPVSFEPVFQSMNKDMCTKCHVPQKTGESSGDSCLLCHRYHVGHYESRVPQSTKFSKK